LQESFIALTNRITTHFYIPQEGSGQKETDAALVLLEATSGAVEAMRDFVKLTLQV
jgi:hypothetical protein